MNKINYTSVKTIEDLESVLKGNTVKPMGGGTDILGTIYDDIHHTSNPVEELISLKDLDLSYIKKSNGGIHIGSMTKLVDVVNNENINDGWNLFADAAKTVASPQIRNMATVGGNLCQEPRCWYYRYPEDQFHCMRKNGETCPAFVGNNLYHSIFGSEKVCTTGCQKGCPNDTEISRYMEKLRADDIQGAAEILFDVNPIAAVTGRICPHTCQSDCSRSEFDESVSVQNVERYLGDYIIENADKFYKNPKKEIGKKIAIVGAGPAGLTAAYYLRSFGFDVTVFDKNNEAGGMLRYSIPSYRLPKDIVSKLIEAIEKMGVKFVLGTKFDKDKTLESYSSDFDGVFIAIGAWNSAKLSIENEGAALSGLDFLYNVSEKKQDKPGDNVLVIGGGNVAMDVALTAKRLGAKKVTIIYRRPKELMPAHEWELKQVLDEGVSLRDSFAPLKVVTDGNSTTGLEVAPTTSGETRNSKTEIHKDKKQELECDCVILATGQVIDKALIENLDLEKANKIVIDPGTYMTSKENVFAGGDVVNGPATVVEAIAHGRRAASGIYEHFTGIKLIEKAYADKKVGREKDPISYGQGCLQNSDPIEISLIPLEDRKIYDEDSIDPKKADILNEADRCFNCGCVAVNASDLAPALIALNGKLITTKREILASDFFSAEVKSSTVLDPNEVVIEVFLPDQDKNNFQKYWKFRHRKSIDFPVVSVALNLNLKGDTIESAKIVLGAVKPTPFEAFEAEEFLTGKTLSNEVAEKAAEIGLANATSLAENKYKINIAKAILKRSIMAAQ